MPKRIIDKSNIILTMFVLIILIGVVVIVSSSRRTQDAIGPTGAEPGGLVLSQSECVSYGGRVVNTMQGDYCTEDEEIISAVTGFNAPALCCVFNYNKRLNKNKALSIAKETEMCTDEGEIADFETYNPNSKTWWFSILSPNSDCKPACVVSDESSDAEINWRCTGLVLPKEESEDVGVVGGSVASRCAEFGGSWLESVGECEQISQSMCDSLGGVFNECGSACRNEPEAEICTMQCVPFCAI